MVDPSVFLRRPNAGVQPRDAGELRFGFGGRQAQLLQRLVRQQRRVDSALTALPRRPCVAHHERGVPEAVTLVPDGLRTIQPGV
jgi:hypothetical protein